MATIVVLEHEFQKDIYQPYMVYPLADFWREAGHSVLFHYGTANSLPPADIAVLHVDMTVIPVDYVAALAAYPRVVNGAVRDIGKRSFSTGLLERDSDWAGPVIVKTNENDGGRPDTRMRQRANDLGRDVIPRSTLLPDYLICDSLGEVPDHVWADPGLIVEKFLPERDERGYYVRIWTFLGDRERSNRYRGDSPVIKSDIMNFDRQVEVPSEIRAWRERLGCDFGKFDYVCPEGRPVLLDVNHTPCVPRFLGDNPELMASFRRLSEGIETLIPAPSWLVPPLPA
jgi:hypothetical protein